MDKCCVKAIVSGKVQGVWFRAHCKQQAEQYGVTGWANNLADGSVEVLLCGAHEAVAATLAGIRQGPPLAKIVKLESEKLPWSDQQGFTTG
jgi:acylphosphatase